MQVQLITPEKTLFSGEATMVIVPGVEGDFGVLAGHAPFISAVRPGVITIEAEGGKRKMAVAGGIAEAVPERCTILAENAVDCAGISPADAQTRLANAKAALDVAETDSARKDAAAALALAEAVVQAV